MNGRYNQLSDAESSHHLLGSPNSFYKDERAPGKEWTVGYGPKKNWIHYSGPLLPPGGNIDEMLKEHDKRIQHAVRKTHLDKTNTKKAYGDNGQRESLLYYGGNGK
ncbi:unnamed protein product [Ilex paraguariensis]|uniref:Uncharacterized protein n=1 Tax=Ilex paraguariensis TaxID=185542 RepID=A0ABC8RX95_9AQUA